MCMPAALVCADMSERRDNVSFTEQLFFWRSAAQGKRVGGARVLAQASLWGRPTDARYSRQVRSSVTEAEAAAHS